MELVTIIHILAITVAFAINQGVVMADGGEMRGRFLAAAEKLPKPPKTHKCDMNPMVCTYAGSDGPNCCGQKCTDVRTDDLNCGKCGKMCKFTYTCCGGKCVDINFDKRHCGGCNNKCQKGVLCIYGMCNYA
ncbi:hypothetical protein QJS10_CPA03g00717 [Acorus calamus]|uniref:Stigma-specific STIG1-like protein 1 n=1 Tax=Acorus calamus TaxID=4465 RepID=A0AAV9F535_ACOCL|nr:hypothetical protein QJS10_CPA03g00716 [Acorus calamus]KAK1321082.1 hypothetical protein QJS10_CPA03g00717 [Acorus calamus]